MFFRTYLAAVCRSAATPGVRPNIGATQEPVTMGDAVDLAEAERED